MKKITISGWLCMADVSGESDDVLCLHQGESRDSQKDKRALADILESDIANTVSSFSYWISTKKASKQEIHEIFTKKLLGCTICEYDVRYSDPTGYLWTTNDLKVGGHDLAKELETYIGRFLIMEVEVIGYPWTVSVNIEKDEIRVWKAREIFNKDTPCPPPNKLKYYLERDGYYLSKFLSWNKRGDWFTGEGEPQSARFDVVAFSAEEAEKVAREWLKQVGKIQ